MKYTTEQEDFWAGAFGNSYIDRNKSDYLLASNIQFFSQALKCAGKISSVIEFGANIGMNLRALKILYPDIILNGIELNNDAAEMLAERIGRDHVYAGSIFDWEMKEPSELTLIKGVLIHINPDMLPVVYKKIYESTSKYILICEYYNPTPVMVPYRGHKDRLFKRDFAGEMLDTYPELNLVDYGFVYRRDIAFPQDDITYFLLSKKENQK